MKLIAITIFLVNIINATFPEGIWIYKQDSSRIEIKKPNERLSGVLISTKNPECKAGTLVLKDLINCEGYFQGQYYISSKERWVEAKLMQKKNLLIIELDLGYKIKKTHWYKG